MRYSIALLLIVSCFLANAQSKEVGRKLAGAGTTKQGVAVKAGDVVRLGKGSLATGWYKHVFTSLSKLDQEAAHLDEGYAFNYATVKEVREVDGRSGKRLIALVRPKGGININYRAVDLEPAIEAKEIIAVNGVAVYTIMKAAKARAAAKEKKPLK